MGFAEDVAFSNLPSNICSLTRQPTDDPVVMHRDLSDWFPDTIKHLQDNRLCNLIIVDRKAREDYYSKLSRMTCVLALSGGLDSTTVLFWARRIFDKVECLIFDYDQRHKIEIEYAKEIVRKSGDHNISYQVVDMSCINSLAKSALTTNIEVPSGRSIEEMSRGVPSTFVPGRNVYFMTALSQVAFAIGARHIALGVNILDYSGYPDCRPEFISSMRTSIGIGIFGGQEPGVHAPLMFLNKKQIIELGLYLGVDYSMTHSCYKGVKGGCGSCDSCQLRRNAFKELSMVDPAICSAQ